MPSRRSSRLVARVGGPLSLVLVFALVLTPAVGAAPGGSKGPKPKPTPTPTPTLRVTPPPIPIPTPLPTPTPTPTPRPTATPTPTPRPTTSARPTPPPAAVLCQSYVDEANIERAAVGAPALLGHDAVCAAAIERANAMAAADSLVHDFGPLSAKGLCTRRMGEIIRWESGYPDVSVDRDVARWMASDAHRTILLRPEYDRAAGAWAWSATGKRYAVMYLIDLC
jgi:uncharacterized protein YkwD